MYKCCGECGTNKNKRDRGGVCVRLHQTDQVQCPVDGSPLRMLYNLERIGGCDGGDRYKREGFIKDFSGSNSQQMAKHAHRVVANYFT